MLTIWVASVKSRPASRQPYPRCSSTYTIVSASCPSPPHSFSKGRPITPVSRISSHFSRGKTALMSSSMCPALSPSKYGSRDLRSFFCSSVHPSISVVRRSLFAEVVVLVALESGREHAHEPHVLVLAAEQVVRIALVQRVHRPDLDLVLGAVHLDHLAAARDAVAGLEMVLVLDQRLRARFDDRVGQRVAHAVRLDQEPVARAVAPLDVLDLIVLANDHRYLLVGSWTLGAAPSSVRNAWKSSTTSRPSASESATHATHALPTMAASAPTAPRPSMSFRFLTPKPTAIGTSVRARSVCMTGPSVLWSGGPTVPLLPYADTR